MAFRIFWGFTHPEVPLRVGRFPKPLPHPNTFRFSWGFTHPEDPFLVGTFPNPPPPLLFGSPGFLATPRTPFWSAVSPTPNWLLCSPGVLPGPRTPFCLAVSPTRFFFTVLLWFYSTPGTLLWALLIVSVLR